MFQPFFSHNTKDKELRVEITVFMIFSFRSHILLHKWFVKYSFIYSTIVWSILLAPKRLTCCTITGSQYSSAWPFFYFRISDFDLLFYVNFKLFSFFFFVTGYGISYDRCSLPNHICIFLYLHHSTNVDKVLQ